MRSSLIGTRHLQMLASLCLALVYALVFITTRRDRRRGDAVCWDDVLFAVAGIAVALYTAAVFPDLIQDPYYRRTEAGIIGIVLAVVTLEATRRVVGTGLAVLIVAFMAYAWWAT